MTKKMLIYVLLTSLFITTLATGCSLNKDKTSTEENKPIPVVVVNAELRSTEKIDRYVGMASASKDIMILPKIAGKVKEIYVKQGETVKEGQVLLKIDDSDYAQSLKQAELSYQAALSNLNQTKEGKSSSVLSATSQLEQAQNSYQRAKENLDKTKDLYDVNAVSKTQLEQAQTTFLQAENGLKIAQDASEKSKSTSNIDALQSQVEQAKINVEKARTALADTKVTSPIEGVVASIMVEVGEMTGPQSPVAQVVNQKIILVKLNIAESSLDAFQQGEKVKITSPAIHKTVDGMISFVSPAANSQTLTFPVEIEVDNKDQVLKSGMLVEIEVVKSSDKKQLVIPTQAVMGTGADTFVFVIKDNKAEKKKIKVKEMATDETIVESGISENDVVVTKGQYELTNGATVEVIKEEGKAS